LGEKKNIFVFKTSATDLICSLDCPLVSLHVLDEKVSNRNR